ncbi:hypothetical protein GALMADRAFT_558706 [Galerina marginata CBS 339.88]|uniref:Uncharacterized protein n=1 Tax=Galerina marginata (strain CBS 339.88) TaxID=685588 RepID=A0A067SUK5_GALM3|nr:hypothetical protein GALMADRAFT_558706 [Galerina marginata CBS 339.88]
MRLGFTSLMVVDVRSKKAPSSPRREGCLFGCLLPNTSKWGAFRQNYPPTLPMIFFDVPPSGSCGWALAPLLLEISMRELVIYLFSYSLDSSHV